MKSLAWIESENAEIEKRIAKKRAASIRRLKSRLAGVLHADRWQRTAAFQVIDAWAKAEAERP